MKQLVKLNKRPSRDGRRFTYFLRYQGEDGKRKWESLGHADRRKAEKQRAAKEKELGMGYVELSSIRLRDFMEDSLARTGDQTEHPGCSERGYERFHWDSWEY